MKDDLDIIIIEIGLIYRTSNRALCSSCTSNRTGSVTIASTASWKSPLRQLFSSSSISWRRISWIVHGLIRVHDYPWTWRERQSFSRLNITTRVLLAYKPSSPNYDHYLLEYLFVGYANLLPLHVWSLSEGLDNRPLKLLLFLVIYRALFC